MVAPKSHDLQMRQAEQLRARVAASIKLPDFDFHGISTVLHLSNMVDHLVDIERITGNGATFEPFCEKREDSPFVIWLRQPGLMMEMIAAWAARQLELLHEHLEAMQLENEFDQRERESLLLAWYARRGETRKAVALLIGAADAKWPNASQFRDLVDTATDGRNRLDALLMMVDGSSLEDSEKNAFHQIIRSVDDAARDVEGVLKNLRSIARDAA